MSMMRTLMYFPTVMADLWGEIFLFSFLCSAGKWCTLVHLMAVNPEKYALALMDALFTDEEIASSCYCVTKRSKKTPLPLEKKGILKFILWTPALYITHLGQMAVFIPEREYKGALSECPYSAPQCVHWLCDLLIKFLGVNLLFYTQILGDTLFGKCIQSLQSSANLSPYTIKSGLLNTGTMLDHCRWSS